MAAVTLAVLMMVRAGVSTVTVTVQRGSVLPAGQLLPGAVGGDGGGQEVVPVSGLSTVTEPVT